MLLCQRRADVDVKLWRHVDVWATPSGRHVPAEVALKGVRPGSPVLFLFFLAKNIWFETEQDSAKPAHRCYLGRNPRAVQILFEKRKFKTSLHNAQAGLSF